MTRLSCGRTDRWITPAWRVSRYELDPTYELSPHAHPRDGLVVVLAGTLALEFARDVVEVPDGGVGHVSHGAVHQEWCRTGPATCLVIEGVAPDRVSVDALERRADLGDRERPVVGTLLSALGAGSPAAHTAADRVIGSLFGGDDPSAPWLLESWSIVERDFRRLPATADIADQVGVSREHLSRAFGRAFGTSLSSYVRQRRLDFGARQLEDTDAPISSIAYASGFADQSHFTRRFRAHFGTTPARYRDSQLAARSAARS